MKPYRIAYICADPEVPVFGRGRESVHVQQMIRALVRQGAEVELFAARFGGGAPDDLCSLATHSLPCPRRAAAEDRTRVCLNANEALFQMLSGSGPFDFVYERYSTSSFAGLTWARMNNAPRLLEVNEASVEQSTPGGHLPIRRLMDDASVLIATSEEAGDHLRNEGVNAEAIHVIPKQVLPVPFAHDAAPTWHWPDGDNPFTIGFVGPLIARSGVRLLLEAFVRIRQCCPEARLLFVGEGPERAVVERRLRNLHLEASAGFAGAVPLERLSGLVASMDVAVAPYPLLADFYFSTLRAFDAMTVAQPRITNRVCQLPGRLFSEGNTLLCESEDSDQLANQLNRFRSNTDLRIRMGEAARHTILTGYAWDQVAAQTLCLAESLLSVRLLANFAQR